MQHHAQDLIPTRQSLLRRLKDWDDQESWEAFVSTYSKLIYGVALKSGLTEQEAEKVKRRVKAKQYQIFDLYAFKKWPVQKVMSTLGISRTQVYLAKLRVSRLMKREIELLETRLL